VNAYYVLSYYFEPYHTEAIELQRGILINKNKIMRDYEGSLDEQLSFESALSTRLEDCQIEFMWTGNESEVRVSRFPWNLFPEILQFHPSLL